MILLAKINQQISYINWLLVEFRQRDPHTHPNIINSLNIIVPLPYNIINSL